MTARSGRGPATIALALGPLPSGLRAIMTREAKDSSSSFPYWVALSSLGVALWLFFANAAPAVRERAELERLDQDLGQLRQSYDEAIHEARLARGSATRQDLQALLVAIDRLGLTPAELCALHPEQRPVPRPADGTDEGPSDGPTDGPTGADAVPPPAASAPRTKFP